MSEISTKQMPPTLADLRLHRDEIFSIARRYRASNVRVFGSVARGEGQPDSDIDFVVDFEEHASLYDVSGLRLDLSELLGWPVDIVELHERTRDRFRQRVLRDAVAL